MANLTNDEYNSVKRVLGEAVARKLQELFNTPAGPGSPGGADTNVQFNDGGAFGGNSRFTFDKTTGKIVQTITTGGGNLFIDHQVNSNSTFFTRYQNLSAGVSAAAGARFYNDNAGGAALIAQILALSSGNALGANKFIVDAVGGKLTLCSRAGNIDFNFDDVADAAAFMRLFRATGNLSIGPNPTDNGYKLDVNGTFHSTDANTLDDLATGGADEMVVADTNGLLKTQAIPGTFGSVNIDAAANFAAGVLTLPAGTDAFNVIVLTTAAGDNITSIAGAIPSGKTFQIKCATGIVNTLQTTLITSPAPAPAAGSIISNGGNLVINGDHLDNVVVQLDSTMIVHVSDSINL